MKMSIVETQAVSSTSKIVAWSQNLQSSMPRQPGPVPQLGRRRERLLLRSPSIRTASDLVRNAGRSSGLFQAERNTGRSLRTFSERTDAVDAAAAADQREARRGAKAMGRNPKIRENIVDSGSPVFGEHGGAGPQRVGLQRPGRPRAMLDTSLSKAEVGEKDLPKGGKVKPLAPRASARRRVL